MTFVNYKNSNNASSKLIADISASATTLLIESGDESIFPNEFPYLLTIEKTNSDGAVILREIVKVTSKVQNSFEVVRGSGNCVQDDTASPRVQGSTAHSFASGDRISLYWTSEQVKDIQERLEASVEDSAIADEYSSSETYDVGDVVMYKGKRYVCNTTIAAAETFDPSKWTETSLQTNIGIIEDDITELQLKSYASDHLEEELLVGCYYEMGDGVFGQDTPKYDDCSVEANIGDVASNTELHIQRQGSGVASNELKLKVKSVGSPTANLYVEVRRGISDIDTTRKITTRYGDENDVIATGIVSTSDITSSFQEITIQLDNDFGETEGELLDVVLFQQLKNVNSEKYFVIACDSTQRSEPFQYLSVNGTTRTRSGYAPYCVSDGCADRQLSKAFKSGNYALPRSLKSLGQKTTITTFGKSIDGERVYHEPDKEVEYDYSPKIFTVVFQEVSQSGNYFIEYKDDASGLTQGSEVFDDFFGYSGVRLNDSGAESGTVDLKNMGAESGLTSGDNVMVKFPIRGIKMTKDTGYTGATEYITLSITEQENAENEGFQYYAFSTGKISALEKKGRFYMGVYEGSVSGSKIRSLSGQTVLTNYDHSSLLTFCTNNGGGYTMEGFYQREYIKALYMMKYCNGNSQGQIGFGCVSANNLITTGGSNSISGTTGGDTVNRTSAMKIFGLENWWGNASEHIGGIAVQSNQERRAALSNFAGTMTLTDNYEKIASGHSVSGVLRQIETVYEDGIYDCSKTMFLSSSTTGSSYSYYYQDQVYETGGDIILVSGNIADTTGAGIFYYLCNTVSFKSTSIGTRIMYL